MTTAAHLVVGGEKLRIVDLPRMAGERGTSEAEIAVRPDRVLIRDTTSTPAPVDIAAMRK